MNLHANEATGRVARSVADKFLKRKGISTAILARFCHSTDNKMSNRMSQKEGEKTGILFVEVGVMRGCNYGGRGSVKTT